MNTTTIEKAMNILFIEVLFQLKFLDFFFLTKLLLSEVKSVIARIMKLLKFLFVILNRCLFLVNFIKENSCLYSSLLPKRTYTRMFFANFLMLENNSKGKILKKFKSQYLFLKKRRKSFKLFYIETYYIICTQLSPSEDY